jgi:hypothetical protein
MWADLNRITYLPGRCIWDYVKSEWPGSPDRRQSSEKQPLAIRDWTLDLSDETEMGFLRLRGAFDLPARPLRDAIVGAYFRWVHPIVPVINKAQFLRQYQSQTEGPPLLLMQTVLLAGSRVCDDPQLLDEHGSTVSASLAFYKKAKALYDSQAVRDPATLVQSVILMGWFWAGPESPMQNVYYWTQLATTLAQGFGMNRSTRASKLSKMDQRLWRRIWWVLFTRDRLAAAALGQPCIINTDHCDVEMITKDDFDESDQLQSTADGILFLPPDRAQVKFFLYYVDLCKIVGEILADEYSRPSSSNNNNNNSTTSDARFNKTQRIYHTLSLTGWLDHCHKAFAAEPSEHQFWHTLLHSYYYTALWLLHKSDLALDGDKRPHPSCITAVQAAHQLASRVEHLSLHDQIRYCPAFMVYMLFSALGTFIDQMQTPTLLSSRAETAKNIDVCMAALRRMSEVWFVGKFTLPPFDSIFVYEPAKTIEGGHCISIREDVMRPYRQIHA